MGGAWTVEGLLEGKAERGGEMRRSGYSRMDYVELDLRKMGFKIWRIIILENGRKSLESQNFGKWV
jgi:hypothetical protein